MYRISSCHYDCFVMTEKLFQTFRGPLSEDLLHFLFFFFTPPGSTSPLRLKWCKLGTSDRQSFFLSTPCGVKSSSQTSVDHQQKKPQGSLIPDILPSLHNAVVLWQQQMLCSTMPTTPSGPLHFPLCGLTSFITAQVHWAVMQVVVIQ